MKMKIKLTEDAKRYITVSEMPAVKKIIADFKEDNEIKSYGQTAARAASGKNGNFEILKAEAEIARNARVWNQYSDESGNLDIWLTFYAYDNYYGFYEIGAYLSDIWMADGQRETYELMKSRMYIRKFKEVK